MIPDFTTVWLFRECLVENDKYEKLGRAAGATEEEGAQSKAGSE